MNTQSSAVPGSFDSPGIAPAPIPLARLIYWTLQRELWENRFIYLAPLAATAVFLCGFVILMIIMRLRMHGAWPDNPMELHHLLGVPYEVAAAMIMATAILVGFYYCLDALYGERRDRSILFWKSLPVSDLTTVLSKLSVPLVVLPLLSFVITIATQMIMLLISTMILMGSGLSMATLWTHSSIFRVSLGLLYHIVTVHGLWYAPFYGWLLMVSAWAPRAPFLWAFLPPFAISGVEKIAFNTSYFLALLERRLIGPEAPSVPRGSMMDAMTALTPAQFFLTPGLWIGLAIAAVFLAAAVRMRRYRGPI